MQKHTKIVATVGPACSAFESLKILAEKGANIFRLNFSHGTHEAHGEVIKRLRRLNQKRTENVAILLDTKGPEIRTGDRQQPLVLEKNQTIILTTDFSAAAKKAGKIPVNYDAFIHDVEVGERVLVDNGVINLQVEKKSGKDVICRVLDGGELGSRRHLNLPGKDISLQSITEKDWADIAFGIEMGVDFLALSFVRRQAEILEIRKFLRQQKSSAKIIAKIETAEAVKNLAEILEAADGVMVARGDLGAEIPFSQVPRVQREIVRAAAEHQKPAIVATHMLESMIENPIPTRAEVTDIAEAVWQRADCVMLSGETAAGKYPEKSVETMAEVICETEKNCLATRSYRQWLGGGNFRTEFCKVAAKMAEDLEEISSILVITRSGFMANQISGFRPKVPIFAFTNEPAARRQMQILWGVRPFRIEFSDHPQTTIERSRQKLLSEIPEQKGQKYILISDFLVDEVFVPTLQIREF